MVISINCIDEFKKILHRAGAAGIKPALPASSFRAENDDDGPNDDPPAALPIAA
jgi:hypothetical protein